MSSVRYRASIITCFVTTSLVCGCSDSTPSGGTTSSLANEQPGSKTVCTTYSPVVDAQVPVTLLAGPLADECAAWEWPPAPTQGPLPSAAVGPNGMGEIWSLVPDFVPALDGDKTVGYVSKYDLFCNLCDDPKPVWDDSLQHVVGHMVAGKGFVRSK